MADLLLLENSYVQRCIDILIKCCKNIEETAWIRHSLNVAVCAVAICHNVSIADVDCGLAFSCGLLHDIGRVRRNSKMRHTIIGYNILHEIGLEKEAQVCLTHSFYLKNVKFYQGENNCTEEELKILDQYIKKCKFDFYDKLIQISDALATSDEICIIEKRIVDVVLRVGIKEYTLDIWREIFRLKKEFSTLCKKDIYEIVFDSQARMLSLELERKIADLLKRT